MMTTYIVTATSLNLRSSPMRSPENFITSLPNGQEVELVDDSNASWWKVDTVLGGRTIRGFVASNHLKLATAVTEPPPHTQISVVHFPASLEARRSSTDLRHCPIGEAGIPRRDANSPARQKITEIYQLLEALDVEHSLRYLRSPSSTYCNIYAYDFCYFAQCYLPRVWWTSKALLELAQGKSVKVAYGKTVNELNANALYDWLFEWGDDFGWSRTFDLTEMQGVVNEGGVGVICAKRRNPARSGHITVVIPEATGQVAKRNGQAVIAPLQSQAGVKNKKTFAEDWWVRLASEYRTTGFWHHK